MPGSRLTRVWVWLVIRLRYLIVAGWVAAAVLAYLNLPSLAQATGGPLNLLAPSGSPALAVQRQSVTSFGAPLLAESAVVQRDPRGFSLAAQKAIVQRAYAIDTKHPPDLKGLVAVVPIINSYRLLPFARESSTTVVTYLYFSPSLNLSQRYRLGHYFEHHYLGSPDAHLVGLTGPGPARWEQGLLMDRSLPLVELATVLLITTIVAIAFRGVLAPLVTLFAAGTAYVISVRVVGWGAARQGLTIPVELEPLLVVLLLAIVTDYSIFFLAGTRRLLRSGARRVDAASATAVEFSPIILVAGLTVVASTASLLAANLAFLRALGPGLAVSVAIGLLAAVTLVPALLAIFGRHLFWPSLGTDQTSRLTAEERARQSARSWRGRLTGLIAHPLVALVVATLLVAALLGAGQLLRGARLGVDLIQGMPASAESARAAQAADRGFAPGVVAPSLVLVRGSNLAAQRPGLVRLQVLLGHEPGVAGVIGPAEQVGQTPANLFLNRSGDAARYLVILNSDPFQAPAIGHARNLRQVLPALIHKAGLGGAKGALGGNSALASETIDTTLGGAWRIGLAMGLVDLLILAFFLRSLLAPIYLLAASMLALGAPIGVGTYLFQRWLGTADISYFVPIAAGVLLVALGSDYNIFVVGRIAEEVSRRPRREALRVAVPIATGAISVAGVTLAASFALLAIVPTTPFREFAFIMAAGILIDSFLVRSYLVPSLIALLGGLGRRSRPADTST